MLDILSSLNFEDTHLDAIKPLSDNLPSTTSVPFDFGLIIKKRKSSRD